MKITSLLAVVFAASVMQSTAWAQTSPITRTPVTKADMTGTTREIVMLRAEFAPGALADWHIHPGEEISYVMEGEVVLEIAGEAPRKINAGEGFIVPARAPHKGHNQSDKPMKLLVNLTVEKGQPLSTPVAPPTK